MAVHQNATVPLYYDIGQMYFIPYHYESVIGPEKSWSTIKVEAHQFFVDHWHLSIWFALCYVMSVQIIKRSMENRKAFELKWPLIIWNGALALFSLAGTIRMGEEFIFVLRTQPLLNSISYTLDPREPAAFWAFCFALSKIFELGDTVFVLLRKKPLIFLHWYHHAVVMVYVWHAAKELVAGGRWFMWMNYAVHTLMYAYYTISAAGFRLPRGVSMLITSLQTLQMLIGVAISCIVLGCKLQGRLMQQSYENLSLCFAIYVSFAILFSNFFKKSYLTEKTKTQ